MSFSCFSKDVKLYALKSKSVSLIIIQVQCIHVQRVGGLTWIHSPNGSSKSFFPLRTFGTREKGNDRGQSWLSFFWRGNTINSLISASISIADLGKIREIYEMWKLTQFAKINSCENFAFLKFSLRFSFTFNLLGMLTLNFTINSYTKWKQNISRKFVPLGICLDFYLSILHFLGSSCLPPK